MKRPTAILLALIALLFVPMSGAQTPASSDLSPVRGEDVYAWCKYLARPEFAGRLTGTDEYAQAARWAGDRFKEWGLRPVDSKAGFVTPFPCAYTLIDAAEMTIIPPPAAPGATERSGEKKLVTRKDFLPYFFSGAGSLEAEVVFAGWGISAPELGYDDYAGLDVKGKFVVCFQGAPPSMAKSLAPVNRHRVRQKTARAKGAAGIFYIQSELVGSTNGEWDTAFFPGLISSGTADLLFAERGMNSAKTLEALKAFERPLSFALKSKIRYRVEARHFDKATGYNVACYIPGSDPGLRGEVLVIGGHLDHLGRHLGEVYPGANDNASGSATVLGLARVFQKLPRHPKRTIIFVLFGGEEMGLLGSSHFVDHLPPFVTKVEAMFNFDMNGVGEGLTVYITPGADDLRDALNQADAKAKILRDVLEVNVKNPSGSDYASFVLKDVPILSFFSNNFEAKYHVPEDTIDQINPKIMEALANEAFRTALLRADR